MKLSSLLIVSVSAFSHIPLPNQNATPTKTTKTRTKTRTKTTTTSAPPVETCVEHKEWRQLTPTEQSSYLDAIQCLRTKPSSVSTDKVKTVWEEIVQMHDVGLVTNHRSPSFLPWHRVYLAIFDNHMRLCGYNGSMPYWDTAFDSQAPEESPIWLSFGGNKPITCLTINGNQWNSNYPYRHCVSRSFNANSLQQQIGNPFSRSQMQLTMENTIFANFTASLEGFPHKAVHVALGGDMNSFDTSPNDPIFFLHHRNLDNYWAKWQAANTINSNAYGGFHPYLGVNVSATDILSFSMFQNVTVQNVLSTKKLKVKGLKCYSYARPIRAAGNDTTPPVVVINPVNYTVTPPRNDRKDEKKIRNPIQMSDKDLKKIGLSRAEIAEFRMQDEATIGRFTDFLNSQNTSLPSTLGSLHKSKKKGVVTMTEEEVAAERALLHGLAMAFLESDNTPFTVPVPKGKKPKKSQVTSVPVNETVQIEDPKKPKDPEKKQKNKGK